MPTTGNLKPHIKQAQQPLLNRNCLPTVLGLKASRTSAESTQKLSPPEHMRNPLSRLVHKTQTATASLLDLRYAVANHRLIFLRSLQRDCRSSARFMQRTKRKRKRTASGNSPRSSLRSCFRFILVSKTAQSQVV